MLTFPLVGRDAELQFATEMVARGGAVVLAGVEGVGKSRLLAAVAERARNSGRMVEWATATKSAQCIPFGALAHLVPFESVDDKIDRVLTALVDALAKRGDGRTRLMCIDDAHLLDDASTTLVQLLVRQPGVAVVATIRTGEPCPDSVTALWKDGTAGRIDLEPLSELEIGELVGKLLGGRVDPATLRKLYRSTRGNGFFLRETLRSGLETGSLSEVHGSWQWQGPPRVCATIRDLLGQRLDQLSHVDRSALEAIALCENLPIEVLGELVDAGVVDRLERHGDIEIADVGGRLVASVRHPMLGEVTRNSLPRLRSDALRVDIADAFATGAELNAEDLCRVATLRLDSRAPIDPDLLLAAARQAMGLADARLTERFAIAVLAVRFDAEAHYLLGEVDVYRGHYDQAVQRWQTLLDQDLPDRLRGRIARSTAHVLGFSENRAVEAEELLAHAEAQVESQDVRQRLAAVRVGLFGHRMPRHELRRVTESLLLTPDLSDEAMVWAWVASARDRLASGQLDSVLAESEAMGARARLARDDWPLASLFVRMCRFYALLLSGRLDDADALAREQLDDALSDHISIPRGVWSAAVGLVLLSRGHLEQSLAQYRDATVVLRRDTSGVLQPALTELAMVLGMRGEMDAARATLDEAERSHRGMAASLFPRDRSRAALLAAQGSVTAARALIAKYVTESRAADQAQFELGGLHDQVRYGGAIDVVERLVELAASLDGPVPQAYANQALAIAADNGDQLVAAAADFDAIGFDLDAAETYAIAANAYRARGQTAAATAATRRTEERRAKCAPVRTPMLSLAQEHMTSLSAREREVAGLAGSGRTDGQIAEELFISVRTVNAHLRSVFAKLGVRSRRDLNAAMDGVAQVSRAEPGK